MDNLATVWAPRVLSLLRIMTGLLFLQQLLVQGHGRLFSSDTM